MALSLSALMGMAALGFDLAYIRLARLQLQNATDAATHAAMVRLRTTSDLNAARSMGVTVAAMNTVLGKPLTLDPADVTFGGWDFALHTFAAGALPSNAVQVTGLRSASTGSQTSPAQNTP